MESDQMLRDLDRAAARPFIEYPRTSWWYPAFVGGYFTAIVAALMLQVHHHPVAMACVLGAAVVALGVFVRWYRSRWGTWPQMSAAPVEIRRAYLRGAAAIIAAAVVTGLAALLGSPIVTTVVAFVSFTTVFWWYERGAYPAACRLVRERLA
jgi:phosphate/sulfate permease